MKTVTKWVTYDNKVHDSQKEALHYLDVEYGNVLSLVSAKIAKLEKYLLISEFIDANLEVFAQLSKIKADMVFEELEGEE